MFEFFGKIFSKIAKPFKKVPKKVIALPETIKDSPKKVKKTLLKFIKNPIKTLKEEITKPIVKVAKFARKQQRIKARKQKLIQKSIASKMRYEKALERLEKEAVRRNGVMERRINRGLERADKIKDVNAINLKHFLNKQQIKEMGADAIEHFSNNINELVSVVDAINTVANNNTRDKILLPSEVANIIKKHEKNEIDLGELSINDIENINTLVEQQLYDLGIQKELSLNDDINKAMYNFYMYSWKEKFYSSDIYESDDFTAEAMDMSRKEEIWARIEDAKNYEWFKNEYLPKYVPKSKK